METLNCQCRYTCRCALAALIVSAIIGIITTFLQITAVITVAPVFLWVAFGVAVVYLGVLVVATALARRTEISTCACAELNLLLAGILGTIVFAVILLAVGIVATSVVSAILIGLLLFFFALVFTATACFVRHLADCRS